MREHSYWCLRTGAGAMCSRLQNGGCKEVAGDSAIVGTPTPRSWSWSACRVRYPASPLTKNVMQSQELTYQKIYTKLAKRTEKYAADVRNVYLKRMGEIARLCEGVEIPDGKIFHFNDYPEIATEAQKQLRSMYSELYQRVRGDVTREWYYANDDVDRLVKAMFGKEAAEQPHFAKYFQRNKQAMDAFFARKTEGMDLSQRVWRIVGEGKQEMELALDLGIGEGMDADALSREVRKFLQEPEKLFRRVRDKHGELVLSKAAKAYHPGQGVYRSSYKNAMRVTRTETNMAYRTADVTRWQQLPFVTGYEVKTSKSHEARMPKGDICDDLAGVYPKGFVFKGWHPHCLCYIVPKLCTDNELEELTGRILEGTEDEFTPAGMVEDVPSQFEQWVSNNAERIENAKSLPYFLRDNYPNGDVSKAGKWVQEIANEAGMGNMAQVVAKSELELAKFTNVQAMSQEDWEACSNFVPAGSDELKALLNAKANSAFNAVSTLGDKATMDAILEQASKGVDAFGNWLSKEELTELQRVATMAKFATKQESKLATYMGRKELEFALGGGKSAQFGQSLKFGTNYTKAAKGALAATEGEQVLVVVRTPAGSRYVQTMAGEAQQAVMLPNTKYKLLSTTEKTIVQAGGKTAKLMQYELELVDDGSTFVEKLVADNAKVQKELAAYTKAKHTAENVIKAAIKGKYELLGVDTLELEDMLAIGKATSAEIKAKTSELAKAMAAAKKQMATKYGDLLENPIALFNQFGADGVQQVYAAVESTMNKWFGDYYFAGNNWAWIKHKLENEIKWVETKKKYPTWQFAQEAYKKQLQIVENKIKLQPLQNDIQAALAFTSKSTKLKSLQVELDALYNAKSVDEVAIKAKLEEAQTEIKRLVKERAKKIGTTVASTTDTMESLTQEQVKELLENYKNNLIEEMDDSLRPWAESVWGTLTEDEKWAITKYTQTYKYLVEPLRGIPYIGSEEAKAAFSNDMPLLESALAKFRTPKSIVVRRGTDNFPINELGYGGLGELKVGDEWTDGAFLSTAVHRNKGFACEYNLVIVVPKGAQGAYAEPFSHYNGDSLHFGGLGAGDTKKQCEAGGLMKLWDGKEKSYIGHEQEWLGQRGCRFKVLKKDGKTIYMQLISQLNRQQGTTW